MRWPDRPNVLLYLFTALSSLFESSGGRFAMSVRLLASHSRVHTTPIAFYHSTSYRGTVGTRLLMTRSAGSGCPETTGAADAGVTAVAAPLEATLTHTDPLLNPQSTACLPLVRSCGSVARPPHLSPPRPVPVCSNLRPPSQLRRCRARWCAAALPGPPRPLPRADCLGVCAAAVGPPVAHLAPAVQASTCAPPPPPPTHPHTHTHTTHTHTTTTNPPFTHARTVGAKGLPCRAWRPRRAAWPAGG